MKLNIGGLFSRNKGAKAVGVGKGPTYDQSQAMSEIEFAIHTFLATRYLEFLGITSPLSDTAGGTFADITVSGGTSSPGKYLPFTSQIRSTEPVLSLPKMWGGGSPGSYLMAQVFVSESIDRPFRGSLEGLMGKADTDFSLPRLASYFNDTASGLLEAAKKVLQLRPLSSDREAELFSQGVVYGSIGSHSLDSEPKVSGKELEAFKLGESVGRASNADYGLFSGTAMAIMRACEASGKDPRTFGRQVLEEILSETAFGRDIAYYNRQSKGMSPSGPKASVSFKGRTYPLHLTGLDFQKEHYGRVYMALDAVLGLQMENSKSEAVSPR